MTQPQVAALLRVMERAAEKVSGTNHRTTRICVGGHVVELVSPQHQSLSGIDIDQAFAGSPVSGHPEFRITLIDDSFTGGPPRIDWPHTWHEPFGIVHSDFAQPYRLALDVYSGSLSAYNPLEGHAIVWFPKVERIPYWYAATPFRLQLSWFADSFGGEMIHAAGLRIDSNAVLIVGPSGAGKSTLALSAVLRGLQTFGDDFLLIRNQAAEAVYARVKLHEASMNLLPHGKSGILGPVMNPDRAGEKRIVELQETHIFRESLPIGAVFIPRQGKQATTRRISSADALRSTLGPTMMGLLGGSRGTIKRIVRAIRNVPVFEIEVGTDSVSNVEALVSAVRQIQQLRPKRLSERNTPV